MAANKSIRNWIVLLLLIICAFVLYNYVYQDHRDIKTESPSFSISSTDINNEFVNNSETSEQKYLNKTIEVSGVISELNKSDLTLDEHVFCAFDNLQDVALKINYKIKIKGRVIGYDDLLEQVKLDQCTILK